MRKLLTTFTLLLCFSSQAFAVTSACKTVKQIETRVTANAIKELHLKPEFVRLPPEDSIGFRDYLLNNKLVKDNLTSGLATVTKIELAIVAGNDTSFILLFKDKCYVGFIRAPIDELMGVISAYEGTKS